MMLNGGFWLVCDRPALRLLHAVHFREAVAREWPRDISHSKIIKNKLVLSFVTFF